MKKYIGLFILVIVLVALSGCTQQAPPAPATPVPTTVITTEVPTPEATAVPTTAPTAEPTTAAPTAEPTTVVVTTTATPKPVVTPSTKVTTIYFRNSTFVPNELTVLPGTGITWVNADSTIHGVKMIGNHTGMFNSGDIIPGSQWSYTFGENEGRFEFKDTYSNSTGMIIVQKGESIVGAPPMQTPKPA
jgi:plastocyanin